MGTMWTGVGRVGRERRTRQTLERGTEVVALGKGEGMESTDLLPPCPTRTREEEHGLPMYTGRLERGNRWTTGDGGMSTAPHGLELGQSTAGRPCELHPCRGRRQ